MRTLFFSLILILAVTPSFGQGLTETFDQSCQCWEVKNHYDDGQLSAIYYENEARQKDGVMKQYSSEGKLLKEEFWKDGKLDGVATSYHPDGSVYLKATYKMGKKMGKWVFQDPDGTPSQEITYIGKGADGVYAHYHAGVRYAEQIIENGKLVDTKIINQEIYEVVQEENANKKK